MLWRIRVGRDGRADLQLRHPDTDLVVEVNACRCWVASDLYLAVFSLWRMASLGSWPTGLDALVAGGRRFAVTNYQFAVVGYQFAVISLAVVGLSVPRHPHSEV